MSCLELLNNIIYQNFDILQDLIKYFIIFWILFKPLFAELDCLNKIILWLILF